MPLTEKGFQRQTFDDILTVQIERAKMLFGEDIDTSDQSVFGKLLRLYCMDAAQNQELAENVYLSAFPHTARGVGLDRLCPFAGIERNPATYAQHKIDVKGEAGAIVEMGFLVAAGDVVFHTVQDTVIPSSGTVTVTVECNEAGTIGNVAVGDINTIVNPSAVITSILHTEQEVVGSDVETDYALRSRFTQALSAIGSGTIDAITGALLRVTGVESVLVEENSTGETVGDLIPHSIRCYVLAPQSAAQGIADAIFAKKPVGIATVGDVHMIAYDIGGGTHDIWFSWAEEVIVYVRCNVTVDSSYSEASLEAIKENIINKLSAYENGQGVTATSLYGAVYVDGVRDVTNLEIGTDGVSYGTDAIVIEKNQVARATEVSIEVTVNE